jgi:HSP20 family protein
MTAITVRRWPYLSVAEPFYRSTSFLDEIEKLAREAWETRTPVLYRSAHAPRTDIYEEKDELILKVELPGISKSGIDISLEGDSLTVRAERKPEKVSEEATYYSCERHFGQFSRTVSLPFPVDAEKVSARFQNGLLEIRLPRAEEAKAKQVEIKVR